MATNRDAWAYDRDPTQLTEKAQIFIERYNAQRKALHTNSIWLEEVKAAAKAKQGTAYNHVWRMIWASNSCACQPFDFLLNTILVAYDINPYLPLLIKCSERASNPVRAISTGIRIDK